MQVSNMLSKVVQLASPITKAEPGHNVAGRIIGTYVPNALAVLGGANGAAAGANAALSLVGKDASLMTKLAAGMLGGSAGAPVGAAVLKTMSKGFI